MPYEWVDDDSVTDDLCLWRGIPPETLKPVDPNTGEQDFSDAAFRTQKASVYIIALTTPAEMAAKFPGWRFREFTAGAARTIGYIICPDPEIDEVAHRILLRGDNPGARPGGGWVMRLKKVSRWVDP
ncbi:MAG: hypothetical protein ACRDFW_10290 [bacterium]